jgi:hypothetical protein
MPLAPPRVAQMVAQGELPGTEVAPPTRRHVSYSKEAPAPLPHHAAEHCLVDDEEVVLDHLLPKPPDPRRVRFGVSPLTSRVMGRPWKANEKASSLKLPVLSSRSRSRGSPTSAWYTCCSSALAAARSTSQSEACRARATATSVGSSAAGYTALRGQWPQGPSCTTGPPPGSARVRVCAGTGCGVVRAAPNLSELVTPRRISHVARIDARLPVGPIWATVAGVAMGAELSTVARRRRLSRAISGIQPWPSDAYPRCGLAARRPPEPGGQLPRTHSDLDFLVEARRIELPNLLHAMQALYQLSYAPRCPTHNS